MRVRIASFAVLLAAVSVPNVARAVASAELYHTQPYVFGRFEARLRFAPADGVISSFFLWKVGSEFGGTFWNELDFEKLGADCYLQTNAQVGIQAGHGILEDHGYAFAADILQGPQGELEQVRALEVHGA